MSLPSVKYRSRAVRALVLLHEQHLRRFFLTWKLARTTGVVLPATEDPAYISLDALCCHVFRSAGGYMVWVCEMLQLPDPGIRPAPDAAVLFEEAERYLEHLIERWRAPLQEVSDERLDTPEYRSRWGTLYSIDAMLEHAVMHPIRHAFQLDELMRDGDDASQTL